MKKSVLNKVLMFGIAIFTSCAYAFGNSVVFSGNPSVNEFVSVEETLQISDGGIVDFGNVSLFAERILGETVSLSGIDNVNWASNGVIYNSSMTLATSVAVPEIREGGVVVLSDDNGQCKSIVLTNVSVRIDEPWQVEFDFRALSRNVDTTAEFGSHGANKMGEAFSFTIQPNGADDGAGNVTSSVDPKWIPSGAEGFAFKTDKDVKSFKWIAGGSDCDDAESVSLSDHDIEMNGQWIHVTVNYDGAYKLGVMLEQNGKVYSASRTITDADANKDYWFTLRASTGSWGTATRLSCYHIVSNFTGRVQNYVDAPMTSKSGFDLIPDNWTTVQKNGCMDIADNSITVGTTASAAQYAFSTNTFKANERVRISLVQNYLDMLSASPWSKGAATAFTFAKAYPATSVSPQFDTGGTKPNRGGAGYCATPTNTCGFIQQVLANNTSAERLRVIVDGVPTEGNGTSDGTDIYAESGILTGTISSKDQRNAIGKPITTTIEYHGDGIIDFILEQDGNKFMRTHDFSGVFNPDDDLVFVISHRNDVSSGNSRFMSKRFSDFNVSGYQSGTYCFNKPVKILEDAVGSLKVGEGVASDGVSTLRLSSVELENGATLNIDKSLAIQRDYNVSFASLSFGGAGTVAISNGQAAIEKITFEDNPESVRKLSGKVNVKDGKLCVQIPQAWAGKRPLKLLDVSGITWGEDFNQIDKLLIDEDGMPLKGELKTQGNCLGLFSDGLVIIVK